MINDYFEPEFLLGLTATPERTDGGDLLALCGENLVYRCDLLEGIERERLVPATSASPTRSTTKTSRGGAPDSTKRPSKPPSPRTPAPQTLSSSTANTEENEPSLFAAPSATPISWRTTFDNKASAPHPSTPDNTGLAGAPRARSLEELRDGNLNVIFAVDIFNEGVDLPTLDTIMMLRPTESRILWMQQFGRGLRLPTKIT